MIGPVVATPGAMTIGSRATTGSTARIGHGSWDVDPLPLQVHLLGAERERHACTKLLTADVIHMVVGDHDGIDVGEPDAQSPHVGNERRRFSERQIATDIEQDRVSVGPHEIRNAGLAQQAGCRHVPVDQRQDFECARRTEVAELCQLLRGQRLLARSARLRHRPGLT